MTNIIYQLDAAPLTYLVFFVSDVCSFKYETWTDDCQKFPTYFLIEISKATSEL